MSPLAQDPICHLTRVPVRRLMDEQPLNLVPRGTMTTRGKLAGCGIDGQRH
jgi:hypothetical protein